MRIFFDFDGVLDKPEMRELAQDLGRRHTVSCLTTRHSIDTKDIEKTVGSFLPIVAIGGAIDSHLFSCKADHIAMVCRNDGIAKSECLLFDNDPNEVSAALKLGISAVLVPSWQTEDFFGVEME